MGKNTRKISTKNSTKSFAELACGDSDCERAYVTWWATLPVTDNWEERAEFDTRSYVHPYTAWCACWEQRMENRNYFMHGPVAQLWYFCEKYGYRRTLWNLARQVFWGVAAVIALSFAVQTCQR